MVVNKKPSMGGGGWIFFFRTVQFENDGMELLKHCPLILLIFILNVLPKLLHGCKINLYFINLHYMYMYVLIQALEIQAPVWGFFLQ